MAKTLNELTKAFDVDNFFDYICKQWLAGNESYALNLFDSMRPADKKDFMNELNHGTFMQKMGDGPWQMEFLREIIYSINI